MNDSFTATKTIIFDTAVGMIATVGFENMSMRELADAVGIKVSSLYYHFSSKQDILDSIYNYYCQHMFDNRASIEQSKRVIESGNREEIFNTIIYDYFDQNEKKTRRMVLTAKIIMMRLFNDERARCIFLEFSYTGSAVYVKELLEYGVSIGRFEDFDIDTYVDLLASQEFFMGTKTFTNPDYFIRYPDEKKRINKMCMDILPIKHER